MRSLASYFIVIVAIIYWIFRVAISLMGAMEMDFICRPLDPNIEIAILFLTVICFIFIFRRSLKGATLYFCIHALYFGPILYNSLFGIPVEAGTLAFSDLPSIVATALGVIIPFFVFMDILIDRTGLHPISKKTDWYYGNKKYDRELDDRADRNQYKIK